MLDHEKPSLILKEITKKEYKSLSNQTKESMENIQPAVEIKVETTPETILFPYMAYIMETEDRNYGATILVLTETMGIVLEKGTGPQATGVGQAIGQVNLYDISERLTKGSTAIITQQ